MSVSVDEVIGAALPRGEVAAVVAVYQQLVASGRTCRDTVMGDMAECVIEVEGYLIEHGLSTSVVDGWLPSCAVMRAAERVRDGADVGVVLGELARH